MSWFVHSVSVLYSRKRKVGEDKNSSMTNLGFQMANLTDSPLEAAKVCQGGNGCWKVVPLNDCKGIKRVLRYLK